MLIEAGNWFPVAIGMHNLIYIEKGAGELYASRDIENTCEKEFLRELSAGSFVLDVAEKAKLPLCINVTEDIEYRIISQQEFFSFPRELVNAFLLNIMTPIKHILQPKRSSIAVLGREVAIKEGESLLAPYGEVFWLELSAEAELEEKSRLLLPERVAVISGEKVITFEKAGKYKAYLLDEFVDKYSFDIIWRIIENEVLLNAARLNAYFDECAKKFERRYEERAELKVQFEHRFKRRILGWVSNENMPGVDEGELPVITALRQIVAKLGMDKSKIVIPNGLNRNSSEADILRGLLNGNDLYGRQIKLEDNWWKMDIGPLLVFRNGEPYAAIPVSPEEYVLIDYVDGGQIKIDSVLADEIDEKAYVFFRKIPENLKSLSDWFGWAFKLCWKHDYLVLLVSCLIIGILPLVVPLITNTVFDDIIPSYDAQAHLIVVQVMLTALCAQAFTTLIRDISVLRIKNNIRLAIEPALWIKLLDLPASFFRKYTVGDLSNRMLGIGSVSSQFSSIISNGLFNGLFGFFNLAVMAYFNIKLAFIACIVWFVYLVFAGIFIYRLKSFQKKHLEASGAVSGKLVQIISGLNVFKVQNAEERAMSLWAENFGESWRYNRKQRWQSNYLTILNQVQPLILNGLIFYFAMTLFDSAMNGRGESPMVMADFLSFFSAMGSFGSSINGFVSGGMGIMGLMPVLERLNPIIAEKNETSKDKMIAPELRGEIILSDVSFRYQEELPKVLRNINLKIDTGSFVAIVGGSGSGKSTLLRLILGLETPTHGIVEYDGQDITQLDISSVRRQLGVVMQRGRLMAGSVLSNIVGSLPLTVDDAWEAAENVGLAEDIRQMPMGMNTYISEDGGNISGGQKQRIMIARAIVNHARIIIFDEATSSLDNETQAVVSETMERLHATRIVVAHRLSTIKNADKIVVLDQGRIVEEGKYDELMKKQGYFTELAARQIL